MNVFLSYASEQRPLADDLCHRLQAAGHEVFFDREDLPAGLGFDEHIHAAIEGCDLFVFLVTPQSVAAGRYTRTELKIASRKWVNPGWHVLPVLVEPTPLSEVPAYLRALNLLQPEGNLVAEVVLEVQERRRRQAAAPPPAEPPSTPPAQPAAPPGDPSTRYRSLQLRFGRDNSGNYTLTLADGSSVQLPIDPAALGQLLWQGAVPVAGTARRGGVQAALPAAAQARAVGQALHDALFKSSAGAALAAELRQIDPQHGKGLRVIVDATAAPELAGLPWEFLYSAADDDLVFSDRLKPLVRRLSLDRPPPVLEVAPPLRLLVAIAAPTDRPELQVGTELAQLDRALSALTTDGRLLISCLANASLERLDDAMLRLRPHVLHFIGHGDMQGDDGVLILESDAAPGSSQPISGRQLAVLLRNHLGSLRLVFLNSCLGAAAVPNQAFGGVAQSLVRRGLPAVVAMQFPVPDSDAVQLARHFYRYLAAGQPVDSALTSARAFMVASGAAVSWGAPALYMTAEDGRLFDIATPLAGPDLAPGFPAPAAPVQPLPQPSPTPTAATAPPPVARPADTAPPKAARSAARSRKGLWLALLAVLTPVLAAFVWWSSLGDSNDAAAPSVEAPPKAVKPPDTTASPDPQPTPTPTPTPTPAPAPAPAPAPPPPPPPPPPAAIVVAPNAAARAVQDSLAAGATARALSQLENLLAADPDALRAAKLGQNHAPLALALAAAARQAADSGRTEQAEALADMLTRMGPFDAALEARLNNTPGFAAGSATPATNKRGAADYLILVVQPGDTLWDLARRFKGDGARWPELWQDHQDLAAAGGLAPIPNPDLLRAGQALALPRPSASSGDPDLRYHVLPADTLSHIARRVYGAAARWPEIRDLNALPDADRLEAGQVLKIRP